MVYRVFVEKKPGLDNEARALLNDARTLLGIENLENVRLINRYDAENMAEELFDYAIKTVFSEPQLDMVSDEVDAKGGIVQEVGINTDAMDWTLPESIVRALKGCRFDTDSMVYALQQAFLPADVCEDLCQLIRKQIL